MADITFEEYVDQWHALTKEIEADKRALKKKTDAEMVRRLAIIASVEQSTPGGLKEGTNNIKLPGDRALKITRTIDRVILPESMAYARELYERINDRPFGFDELLRMKYELVKDQWKKLSPEAVLAVSHMIETKVKGQTVELIE